jgi:hypothetical protein
VFGLKPCCATVCDPRRIKVDRGDKLTCHPMSSGTEEAPLESERPGPPPPVPLRRRRSIPSSPVGDWNPSTAHATRCATPARHGVPHPAAPARLEFRWRVWTGELTISFQARLRVIYISRLVLIERGGLLGLVFFTWASYYFSRFFFFSEKCYILEI